MARYRKNAAEAPDGFGRHASAVYQKFVPLCDRMIRTFFRNGTIEDEPYEALMILMRYGAKRMREARALDAAEAEASREPFPELAAAMPYAPTTT